MTTNHETPHHKDQLLNAAATLQLLANNVHKYEVAIVVCRNLRDLAKSLEQISNEIESASMLNKNQP